MSQTYSRRAVLARIGLGGAAAAAGATTPLRHAFAQADAIPWYFLTDDEARWLAAITDVLIPEDDFPSATQAGVVDYIDFALAGDYGRGERLYMRPPFFEGAGEQGWQVGTPASLIRTGLTALREGNDVTALDEAGRERWVQALSEYEEPLGDVPAGTFFDEVHSLTNEGYFADPIYLGNHDYAGWRMVGFPGAHAYYTERVDDHGYRQVQPPMGIAHTDARSDSPPRLIGGRG